MKKTVMLAALLLALISALSACAPSEKNIVPIDGETPAPDAMQTNQPYQIGEDVYYAIKLEHTAIYYPDGADEASAEYVLEYTAPVFTGGGSMSSSMNEAVALFIDELMLRVTDERLPFADRVEGEPAPKTLVTCVVSESRGYINVIFDESVSFSGGEELYRRALVLDREGTERGLAYVSGCYEPAPLVAQRIFDIINASPSEYYTDIELSDIISEIDLFSGYCVMPNGFRVFMPAGAVAPEAKGVVEFEIDSGVLMPPFVGDMISTQAYEELRPILNDLCTACVIRYESFEGAMSAYAATEFMARRMLGSDYDLGGDYITVPKADFEAVYASLIAEGDFPGIDELAHDMRLDSGAYVISREFLTYVYSISFESAELHNDGTLVLSGSLMYGAPGDASASFVSGVTVTLSPWEDSPCGYRIVSFIMM